MQHLMTDVAHQMLYEAVFQAGIAVLDFINICCTGSTGQARCNMSIQSRMQHLLGVSNTQVKICWSFQ